MFGLSLEHLLLFGVILLIFGPRKLPELGSSIGKAIRNFKEGLSGPSHSVNPPQNQIEASQPQSFISTAVTKPVQNSLSDADKSRTI